SIKSSISFSAASMVLDLFWLGHGASYRTGASTLCRELRPSPFVQAQLPNLVEALPTRGSH
ncbi:MAG: hypothetical protein WBE50_02200, partial [Methyloceanibacter sp.]